MEHLIIFDSLLHAESPAWKLVSKNKACSGLEIGKDIKPNAEIKDCAKACEGVSAMFVFIPRNNLCFCEVSASQKGTCDMIDLQDADLYQYGIHNQYINTLKKYFDPYFIL